MRTWLVYAGILFLIVVLFSNSSLVKTQAKEWNYEEFIRNVTNTPSRVVKGVIRPRPSGLYEITGHFVNDRNASDPQPFRIETIIPEAHMAPLMASGRFVVKPENTLLTSFILTILPVLIIVFCVYFFFIRQIKIAGKGALNFGKSKARLHGKDKNKVTFKDVAGIEEAKDEVLELVEFLKDPKKFQKLGGRIPKGILMFGAPGTGKTLLAKAIAGEADASFFSISGSDFVEMFVGVGASRVRDMFEQARKSTPCLVFIDE